MRRPRRADDYPYFDNGGLPAAFAHRGGPVTHAGAGIENSMSAFQAAIDRGYRYIETDVQASSDGVAFVFHDVTLKRATDTPGTLSDLTADQVGALRLDGREPIPRLDELFSTWPDVRFNIDAKSSAAVPLLAEAVARHRAWDRVCLAAFSARSMHDLRELVGPRVPTSYSRWGIASMMFLPTTALREALLSGGQVAQVPWQRGPLKFLTRSFVDRVHEAGKHIHAWTIDDADEIGELLDLGVDGVMTDHIDTLRDVYQARGVWKDAA